MDDGMLLPLAEREEAFMMEANLPDVLLSMKESGNFPNLDDEQLAKQAVRDINATLGKSQCYVCQFAKKKRVGFFWFTPTIAQRYLSVRDSLMQMNGRIGSSLGQDIAAVVMTPTFTHSSPLRRDGQVELIPRYAEKVHAFWADTRMVETIYDPTGDSIKRLFRLDHDTRPDLHWYPIDMINNKNLDEVYVKLQASGVFVNVEPFVMPAPAVPFPVNATNVSQAERLERQQQCLTYEAAQRRLASPTTIRNVSEKIATGGLLEVSISASGLTCNRQDYPNSLTPVLTWKQIKKVIPKSQRKPQRQSGQQLAVRRRQVVVQIRE